MFSIQALLVLVQLPTKCYQSLATNSEETVTLEPLVAADSMRVDQLPIEHNALYKECFYVLKHEAGRAAHYIHVCKDLTRSGSRPASTTLT